jgi:hypothetical protein
MAGLFVLLLAFALWLVWITYFRDIFQTGLVSVPKPGGVQEIMQPASAAQEHFHNLGEAAHTTLQSSSLCFSCHGSFPHFKGKDTRAFLNAHAYFMACETCHVHRAEKGEIQYKWLDNTTGQEITWLDGEAGNYGGKIVPIKAMAGEIVRLDQTRDREFAQKYLDLRDRLSADQQAAAKLTLHRDLSEKAVACMECHRREESYLPLQALGYSKRHVSRLTGNEVVGMLRKYEVFHLPDLMPRSN